MKNHYKNRFILFGTVFGTVIAIIIAVLVAVFSSKIAGSVVLPVIAFGYLFLDFLDFLISLFGYSADSSMLFILPFFFLLFIVPDLDLFQEYLRSSFGHIRNDGCLRNALNTSLRVN